MQIYGQIGLLRTCWNIPCFSLHGKTAGDHQHPAMTFPALVKEIFGQTLPENANDVVVIGSILCVSMSEVKVFGPYTPNALMLDACLNLGERLWNGMADIHSGQAVLNDIPTAGGYHPLCDYCEENKDCPRFDGMDAYDIEDDLRHLLRLRDEKILISKNIQEEENKLRQLCRGCLPQAGWLNAETMRIRLVSCEGKRTFDKDLLSAELERHLDTDVVTGIMESAYRPGKPYDRLMVNTINQKEE
jgi:hypothetical protein